MFIESLEEKLEEMEKQYSYLVHVMYRNPDELECLKDQINTVEQLIKREETKMSSKYHVMQSHDKFFIVMVTDECRFYFNGYDFMGSVNWEGHYSSDYGFNDVEEAWQILKDLEAADKPAEPKRINNLKSEKVEYIGQFKRNGKWSTVTNYCNTESEAATAVNRLIYSLREDKRPDGIAIVKVTTTYEVVR